MTPWQLAKDSESSHQTALFCFVNKAIQIGFVSAKVESYYKDYERKPGALDMVPELQWFHAIPNGGSRGDTARSRAIAGGQLKAEGVRAGVLDCFWPLTKKRYGYCGLYIEMKKPALKNEKNNLAGCSDEQKAFGEFVTSQDYKAIVCYTWLEAAQALEWYYELGK